jgi:hypothetical protein
MTNVEYFADIHLFQAVTSGETHFPKPVPVLGIRRRNDYENEGFLSRLKKRGFVEGGVFLAPIFLDDTFESSTAVSETASFGQILA